MKLFAMVAALAALAVAGVSGSCNSVISSESGCETYCQNTYSTNIFIFSSSYASTSCSCEVGGVEIAVCTTTTTTTTTTTSTTTTTTSTTSTSYTPPTAAELRAHLLSLVGAQCTTAVNASITTQFATCLAEFDTDRHSYPRTAENDFLNEVCDSTCFTNLFSALDALDSADCLPSEDASDDIVTNLYRLRLLHTQLTFMCSRSSSNNKYCGRVLNFLDLYRNDSSSFTDSNCESIVNHGNCLGSILVAGEADPVLLEPYIPQSVDIAGLVCNVAAHCRGLGVNELLLAAAQTESPANLANSATSSASTATAAAAFTIATLVAAAFVM